MADDSSQEKTEDATPRRLREAREKGQVPKSKDVSTILVLIVEFLILASTMTYIGDQFRTYFQLSIDAFSRNVIDGGTLYELGKAGLITLAKILAPFLLGGMVISVFSGFIQVGAIFATDPLVPKFEKLNPIEGFKNMFKVTTFIELAKNLAKIGLILYIGYKTVANGLYDVMSTSRVDVFIAAKIAGGMIFDFVIKVCVLSIAIAALDYMAQRWKFMKDMRMSKDEVKREYKQDEGDPHVKGERRRLQREMATGDVRKAVKKADAVVTNPIHVACVIEYNKAEMGAPTLTAKGQRAFAEMIVEMAKEEGIPIIRNIPLAWSLVKLEIEDEIPEELYEAVAEVLTLVYEMKNKPAEDKAPETAQPPKTRPPSLFLGG